MYKIDLWQAAKMEKALNSAAAPESEPANHTASARGRGRGRRGGHINSGGRPPQGYPPGEAEADNSSVAAAMPAQASPATIVVTAPGSSAQARTGRAVAQVKPGSNMSIPNIQVVVKAGERVVTAAGGAVRQALPQANKHTNTAAKHDQADQNPPHDKGHHSSAEPSKNASAATASPRSVGKSRRGGRGGRAGPAAAQLPSTAHVEQPEQVVTSSSASAAVVAAMLSCSRVSVSPTSVPLPDSDSPPPAAAPVKLSADVPDFVVLPIDIYSFMPSFFIIYISAISVLTSFSATCASPCRRRRRRRRRRRVARRYFHPYCVQKVE
jgi:hypothetical protein